MKYFLVLMSGILLGLTGCSKVTEEDVVEYLKSVPNGNKTKANEQGQVVEVSYDSIDYTINESVVKTAYVYLPHNYNEVTSYDILYLMHGWTMTAYDFFDPNKSNLINRVDHMIEEKVIPPVIIVSATFDRENHAQNFSRSVDELSVFHQDFKNHLMPYIESHFSTYARDTTKKGLEDSREHRAFGGFSLGAVTTWYQFIYNLDTVKYFLPMSGDCWIMQTYGGLYQPVKTVDYLESVVEDHHYSKADFKIYQGIGTDDPIWNQTDSQIQEMMKRDTFNASNLHYAIIEGGRHNMVACECYLYYGLINFFGFMK